MSAAPERWKFVGGRLCLDFINTVGAWASRQATPAARPDYQDLVLRDRLNNYEELVEWSREAGDLSPGEARALLRLAQQKPRDAARVFVRAIESRETLYRLFKSVVENWQSPVADLEAFQKQLGVARERRELVKTGERFAWQWIGGQTSLDRPLWPIVESAEALLTAENLIRVRQCGGEECGWFFLDESRGGRRQWCEMSDCGNLAKVRRHRERQRQAGV